MQFDLPYGRKTLALDVADDRLVPLRRAPVADAVPDAVAAVRAALEKPFDFPALRRALTPDDHLAVVVDERLTRLPELLTAVLEHAATAGVRPEDVTVVCPRS